MMDAKTIRDLVGTIRESNSGTSAYDTTAQVLRVEGGTAWVHIPGGVDETPVALSINAVEGDTVRIRVSGGQAWIMGNDSAPPTDDRTANTARAEAQTAQTTADAALRDAKRAAEAADSAETAASEAQTAAEQAVSDATAASSAAQSAQTAATAAGQSASRAQAAADAAQGDIDNLQEYFWHDALGAHVLSDTNEVSSIRYRTDLKGAGQTINRLNADGTETEMAKFSADEMRIGPDADASHVSITASDTVFYGADGSVVGKISQGSSVGTSLTDIVGESSSVTVQEGTSFKTTLRGNAGNYVGDKRLRINIYNSRGATSPRAQVIFANSESGYQEVRYRAYYSSSLSSDSYCVFGVSYDSQLKEVEVSVVELEEQAGSIGYFIIKAEYTAIYNMPYYQFGSGTYSQGTSAFSEGSGTKAIGHYSHAEGYETESRGSSSHSEGDSSIASGHASHAEGGTTTASDSYSHAEGHNTIASNIDAHAEGEETEASGIASHAEGMQTVASGNYSHASGEGTIANGNSQTVIGHYNEANTTDLFIVGNGVDDSNRSNAFSIAADGTGILAGKMTFNGGIAVKSADRETTPSYFLTMDAFSDGGSVNYIRTEDIPPALGLANDPVDVTGSVSAASGSDATVCNTAQYGAGVYLVSAYVSFPASSSGRRHMHLATTNTGSALDNWSQLTLAPSNAQPTIMNMTGIYKRTSTGRWYLRAYQNSGSTQTVSGGIRVLKLH